MSTLIEGLLFSWQKNKDYGQRLVTDLSEEQMVVQPNPGARSVMNHPAWVFSHLNAYHPVIVSIIKGESFEDPAQHRFGMKSKPEADRSIYASKDELVQAYVQGHDDVTAALTGATDAVFDHTIDLPRWKPVLPNAGIALPYLMLLHENTHLGQLSAWRRVQGLPSV